MKAKPMILQRPCGCIFDRESGARVHTCAGHRYATPPLQLAKRETTESFETDGLPGLPQIDRVSVVLWGAGIVVVGVILAGWWIWK